MKKHIFLILIFVGLSNCAYLAQIINYTNTQPFIGHRFGQLVPGNDEHFYTLGYKRINLAYSIPLYRKYRSNELLKEVPVAFSAAANNEVDRDFFRFKDQLILQTESAQFGNHNIFLYTTDLELTQQSNKINAINMSLKSNEHVARTGYIFDQDSTHLLIYGLVEDVLNRTFRMYYSVFDQALNLLESNTKQFIFPSENIALHSIHLSNENHLLAVFKSSIQRYGSYRFKQDNPPAFFIVDLRKTKANTVLFKLEGLEVMDLVVHPLSNQNWLLSGSWFKPNNGDSGFFNVTYDSNENVYYNEYIWDYFKTAQVSSVGGYSRQGNFYDVITPERSSLENFVVHSFIPKKDGYVMVLEERYVQGIYISQTEGGGFIDNPVYYNNNIVVAYFDKLGNLKMTHEIVKNMQQSNRRNATHSFAMFLNDNQLTFLFNDSKMNYNESRIHNGRNVTTLIRKRKVGLAKVNLDLDLGTSRRTLIADYADSKGFFLPNKTALSTDQRYIFMAFHQNLANQMYHFGVFRVN